MMAKFLRDDKLFMMTKIFMMTKKFLHEDQVFMKAKVAFITNGVCVCGAVLFTGVGQPVYSGPSKVKELTPALVETLIKKGKKPTAKHWLVFFYAPWSDYCLEHDAMIADLSLAYSSEHLAFGRVDLNQWTDLAVEYNIDTSATSWQLPSLILFQDGKEAVRLPQFDDKGNIRKTVLHRVCAAEKTFFCWRCCG